MKLDIVFYIFHFVVRSCEDYAFDRITMASHMSVAERWRGYEGGWEIGRRTGAQLNGRQAFVIESTFGDEDDEAKMKVQALAEATQERLRRGFVYKCRMQSGIEGYLHKRGKPRAGI